jgi:hypothetical protein
VLTGITPILTELENLTQMFHITHRNELDGLHDAPKDYKKLPHPAEAIELKDKRDDTNYTIEFTRTVAKKKKG